ncbi:MAG: 5-formyltetrahydrofolate cyclo-ligase [Candidatus Zixiibacteriota bacterium]
MVKQIFKDKNQVRYHIWDLMLKKNIAIFPLPPYGRIPNFKDARITATQIKRLPLYRNSGCVFTGPDSVLRPLRDQILRDKKILAYATPHMKEIKMLRPESGKQDTSIKGLVSKGEKLTQKVDIAVVGSVAVDFKGNRLGKGSGYGDQEIEYLRTNKLITNDFKVGTLVHTIQLIPDLSIFKEPHDIPVDFILIEKELLYSKS